MRLLVLLAGCTLIVGDRRQASSRDMAGSDGAVSSEDGGLVGSCSVGEQLVDGANQLSMLEALDVAQVGGGRFAVVFAKQSGLYRTIVETGPLNAAPTLTLLEDARQIYMCSPACLDPRVAGNSPSDRSSVWFSALDGPTTVLVRVQTSDWEPAETLTTSCLPGTPALTTGVASLGSQALAATACETGSTMVGTSVSPAPFPGVSQALEVRLHNTQTAALAGWVQKGAPDQFGAMVAQLNPGNGSVMGQVGFGPESQMISGLAFAALDGSTPPRMLAAYTVGSAHTLKIFPATLGGGSGTGTVLGTAASVSMHQPLGVAAGVNSFLVAYTDPGMGKARAMVQLVSAMGGLLGEPIALGLANVVGTAPRVSYSPEGDRFAVVWAGPPDAGSLERVGHIAILQCH